MATKQQWLDWADQLVDKAKEVKEWAKDLPDGEVDALDAGPGSNPPTPPPPPPPSNS